MNATRIARLDESTVRSINRKYPDIGLRLMLMTTEQDGCVVWRGGLDKDGYARVRVSGAPYRRLSRIVWELAHGRRIPEGMVVRHRCDNPPCVHPDHLLLGTVLDNNRDRVERGRGSVGEAHHAHRLSASQAREIRQRTQAGESVVTVAREFGVRPWSIEKIRDGVTWKHL